MIGAENDLRDDMKILYVNISQYEYEDLRRYEALLPPERREKIARFRFDGDKLIILHTKKARFLFDHPVAWTRDGEEGGEYSDITLVNYHRPVQLIF